MFRFGKYIASPLLVLVVLFFTAGPVSAGSEKTSDFTLPNGLKVILIENHRAPVVSMLVWVKVGSSKEEPGEYGLTHLLEHMLFKGTHDRGVGTIAKEVEALGGNINAYTSLDQTVFYIDMAGRYAGRGLEILSDMVLHPSLDPDELAKEKDVVIEELNRGLDNPDNRLSEALFKTAFSTHPYGRPVIGYRSSIRGVSPETVKEFHHNWYTPNNMVLVVAGDFQTDSFRKIVEKVFKGAQPAPTPQVNIAPLPPQRAPRSTIVRADVNTASLRLAWPVPGADNPDIMALDVLAYILGTGRTSRLYTSVKRDQELVNSISAGAYTPEDRGLFLVGAALDPDKVEKTITAVESEINGLIQGGISREELSRAKLNFESYLINARETMSGEARVAANFEVFEGDYRAKNRYLEKLRQVTADDIVRVAKTYLQNDQATIGVLLPQKALPDMNQQALVGALESGRETVIGKFQEFKLSNGARLLVKAEQSLPLVSVRAAFLGGLRYETPAKAGLNNLLAEVWDRETQDHKPEDLAQSVEDIAADISSFSGRNSFGLEGEFLKQSLDQGLNLFVDVLTRPALSREEVERAKPNILAAIKQQEDQLPARTFKLFSQNMYAGNPYGLPLLGTPESVGGLTAKDIRSFYENYARPDNLVLSVVGDVDPANIRDFFEKALADWKGHAAPAPEIKAPDGWTGLKTVTEKLERNQTHYVLGVPAPGLESPDRFPLEVLDKVLSGMGGRLFLQLRDRQSLAYTVTSFYSPGLDTGAFGFYIAFEPDKFKEVKAGFDRIVKDLLDRPVTAEELAAAKANIMGSYSIGLQRYSTQAAEAAFDVLYGLGLDYPDRYVKGINAVTAKDVQRVARKYLGNGQKLEVVVGSVQNP